MPRKNNSNSGANQAAALKSIGSLTREDLLEQTLQPQEFDDLLGELSNMESKIKALWKQIYQNAVMDRVLAHANLADVMSHIQGKEDGHAIYGMTIAKYLERMEKATNQIIKLAELVEEYKRREDAKVQDGDGDDVDTPMTPEDIYERIGKHPGAAVGTAGKGTLS